MTPVVLLVVFCAAMATVAVGRLAMDDDRRDPVEIGSALVVVGITPLTAVWVAIEASLLNAAGLALLALTGVALVGSGVTVMVRYWEASSGPKAPGD